MKNPDWRTLPLVAKPPPLYTVTLVINGRLTEQNFAAVAAGFLAHFCQLGWHLGRWPQEGEKV